MKGATIYIDDQETTAISNADGRYTLSAEDFPGKTLGSFKFEAKLQDVDFKPLKIKIDKETIELPELKAEYVSLCGNTFALDSKDMHYPSKPRKILCKN